jgi:hypothetical protein
VSYFATRVKICAAAAATAGLVKELLIRVCSAIALPKYIRMKSSGYFAYEYSEGVLLPLSLHRRCYFVVCSRYSVTCTGLPSSVISMVRMYLF